VLSDATDRGWEVARRGGFLGGVCARGRTTVDDPSKREGTPNEDAPCVNFFRASAAGNTEGEEKIDIGSEGGSGCFFSLRKASSLGQSQQHSLG
jgi:hypothetical protein